MITLDYTRRIPPAMLKAAGVDAVSRYLAPGGLAKVISIGEYRELIAAGIKVFLNWEDFSNDWMHGPDVAINHAELAVTQAVRLGYPKSMPITGSCDMDVGNIGTVMAYGLAFRDVVKHAGYPVGVYGPSNVLGWAKENGYDFFWQSMSAGFDGGRNAGLSPHAHWWQTRTPLTVGGVSCDQNRVVRDTFNIGVDMNLSDPVPGTKSTDGTFDRDRTVGEVLADLENRSVLLLDVRKLTAAVNALTPGAPDVEAAAVVAALKPLLPHHVTFSGEVT